MECAASWIFNNSVELRIANTGPLGELTQRTRYLEWRAGPGEQYTTKYSYDTWNRLQQLVYPDGEVLTYDYDVGGQMHAVQGRKGSYDYHR